MCIYNKHNVLLCSPHRRGDKFAFSSLRRPMYNPNTCWVVSFGWLPMQVLIPVLGMPSEVTWVYQMRIWTVLEMNAMSAECGNTFWSLSVWVRYKIMGWWRGLPVCPRGDCLLFTLIQMLSWKVSAQIHFITIYCFSFLALFGLKRCFSVRECMHWNSACLAHPECLQLKPERKLCVSKSLPIIFFCLQLKMSWGHWARESTCWWVGWTWRDSCCLVGRWGKGLSSFIDYKAGKMVHNHLAQWGLQVGSHLSVGYWDTGAALERRGKCDWRRWLGRKQEQRDL